MRIYGKGISQEATEETEQKIMNDRKGFISGHGCTACHEEFDRGLKAAAFSRSA